MIPPQFWIHGLENCKQLEEAIKYNHLFQFSSISNEEHFSKYYGYEYIYWILDQLTQIIKTDVYITKVGNYLEIYYKHCKLNEIKKILSNDSTFQVNDEIKYLTITKPNDKKYKHLQNIKIICGKNYMEYCPDASDNWDVLYSLNWLMFGKINIWSDFGNKQVYISNICSVTKCKCMKKINNDENTNCPFSYLYTLKICEF